MYTDISVSIQRDLPKVAMELAADDRTQAYIDSLYADPDSFASKTEAGAYLSCQRGGWLYEGAGMLAENVPTVVATAVNPLFGGTVASVSAFETAMQDRIKYYEEQGLDWENNKALQDQAFGYASLISIKEGVFWTVGGDVFKAETSSIRIMFEHAGLDGLLGFGNNPVDALIDTVTSDKEFMEAWNERGGLKGSIAEGSTAFFISLASEYIKYKSYQKAHIETNADGNSNNNQVVQQESQVTKIEVEVDGETREFTEDEFQTFIDQRISEGATSPVKVTSYEIDLNSDGKKIVTLTPEQAEVHFNLENIGRTGDSKQALKYLQENKDAILEYRKVVAQTSIDGDANNIRKMLSKYYSSDEIDKFLKSVTGELPNSASQDMYNLIVNIGNGIDSAEDKANLAKLVQYYIDDSLVGYEIDNIHDIALGIVDNLNGAQSHVKFTVEEVESVLSAPKGNFTMVLDESGNQIGAWSFRQEAIEAVLANHPGYEAQHLAENFSNGAVKLVSEGGVNYSYVAGFGGNPDQYYSVVNTALENGMSVEQVKREFESALALKPGYCNDQRIVWYNPNSNTFELPRGNEYGAWEGYFNPFGYTAGHDSFGNAMAECSVVGVNGQITDQNKWIDLTFEDFIGYAEKYNQDSKGYSTFSEFMVHELFD